MMHLCNQSFQLMYALSACLSDWLMWLMWAMRELFWLWLQLADWCKKTHTKIMRFERSRGRCATNTKTEKETNKREIHSQYMHSQRLGFVDFLASDEYRTRFTLSLSFSLSFTLTHRTFAAKYYLLVTNAVQHGLCASSAFSAYVRPYVRVCLNFYINS